MSDRAKEISKNIERMVGCACCSSVESRYNVYRAIEEALKQVREDSIEILKRCSLEERNASGDSEEYHVIEAAIRALIGRGEK